MLPHCVLSFNFYIAYKIKSYLKQKEHIYNLLHMFHIFGNYNLVHILRIFGHNLNWNLEPVKKSL